MRRLVVVLNSKRRLVLVLNTKIEREPAMVGTRDQAETGRQLGDLADSVGVANQACDAHRIDS